MSEYPYNDYNITGYINTGFNGVNIPHGPELLDSLDPDTGRPIFERIDLPSLGILQGRYLSSIKVRATYEQVKDVDYIHLTRYNGSVKVDDDWYFVTTSGVQMISYDTAVISISQDYITSVGGVDKIMFTDGLTVRVSGKEEDFSLNYFLEPDPLYTPLNPLEADYKVFFNGTNDNFVVLESTISLERLMDESSAKTFESPGGQEVTFPKVVPIPSTAINTYYIGDIPLRQQRASSNYKRDRTFEIGGNTYTVEEALGLLNGLNLAGTILHQTLYDKYYVDTYVNEQSIEYPNVLQGRVGTAEIGMDATRPSIYYPKRLTYGEFTRFIMITGTGDSCTVNYEDCEDDNPNVLMIVDPRPDGRPYYKIPTKTNGGGNNEQDWNRSTNGAYYRMRMLQNTLPGIQWQQIPLVWAGNPGSALNRIAFDNEQEMRTNTYDIAMSRSDVSEEYIRKNLELAGSNFRLNTQSGGLKEFIAPIAKAGAAAAAIGATIATGGTAAAGIAAGVGIAAGSAGSELVKTATQTSQLMKATGKSMIDSVQDAQYEQMQLTHNSAIRNLGLNNAETNLNYQGQRKSDRMNFEINNVYKAPTVSFPYNADIVRDFVGNGVLVIRLKYTEADKVRIGRLVKQYGERLTVPAQNNFLTGQGLSGCKYFSYCEVTGAKVQKNTAPSTKVLGFSGWLADAIAAQLGNGVRVWHSLYKDGAGNYYGPGNPYYYQPQVGY